MKRWFFESLHPQVFHGFEKKAPYFEGWYFRLVNATEDKRYAVIVGAILSGNAHAFIQVLEGHTRKTAYHRFPIEQFKADKERFFVRLGENAFSSDRLVLCVDRPGMLGRLNCDLRFVNSQPWPVRWYAPGAMGFFGWLPFLECNHGVVSFDHTIQVEMHVDGERINFNGGRGYIEKDWGRAFPSAYIWMQSNHFAEPDVSLMASVARVPLLGMTLRGFIIALSRNGRLTVFSTYNGAQIDHLSFDEKTVKLVACKGNQRLEIEAQRAEGGIILGPTTEDGMAKRVDETLDARLHIRLTRGSDLLYAGTGRHAGLEVNGEAQRLIFV